MHKQDLLDIKQRMCLIGITFRFFLKKSHTAKPFKSLIFMEISILLINYTCEPFSIYVNNNQLTSATKVHADYVGTQVKVQYR